MAWITFFLFATLVSAKRIEMHAQDHIEMQDVPSGGTPKVSEVWKGVDIPKQSYYWFDEDSGDVAVVYVHGIFGTSLFQQETDQLFGELLEWGFPVCSFDNADFGRTRLLQPEYVGKSYDEIMCSENAGFNLSVSKSEHFMERYVEPVQAFPEQCAQRLEALLGKPKGSMMVILFGHSWGANLVTTTLQRIGDLAPNTDRVIGTVSANMGLDTRAYEMGPRKWGRNALIRLSKWNLVSASRTLGTGITHKDVYVVGLDPDVPENISLCPALAFEEERVVSVGWGIRALELSKGLKTPPAGVYRDGIPTFHLYCSSDETIVPAYILQAAQAQADDAKVGTPICMLDVAQHGQCKHMSFPGRTTGWDSLNSPWTALYHWISTIKQGVLLGCPAGTKRLTPTV